MWSWWHTMVGEMVQNLQIPYSFAFNNYVVIQHVYKFTLNDIFPSSYEYIYLQLQRIFIHIQGQKFYSTLLLYSFNSSLMCWNSPIPCSLTLNDLILFNEYIHSRSRSKILFNTVAIFIQHFMRIPLYAFPGSSLHYLLETGDPPRWFGVHQ